MFSASIGCLIPHLVSGIGYHDRLAVGKQSRQFLRNEPQKWVGLCAGKQERWGGDLSDRARSNIGEEDSSRHHHVPFVGIAQRLIASRPRHLFPRMGIVEDVIDENSDPRITIALGERLPHGRDHPPLYVL